MAQGNRKYVRSRSSLASSPSTRSKRAPGSRNYFIFLSFGWVLQISQSYTSPITEEPTNSITRRSNSPLIWLYLETSLARVFAPIHPPIHRMYSLYCDWNKRDDTEDFRHGRRSCRSVVEVMRRVDRCSVRR